MYQAFAGIYDELMNDVDYEGWADHYVRLLSIYGVRGGKICECACGTGGLTIPLAARGFSMTGVDLSSEMLWEAAVKSRKAGIAIPFVRQDMRGLHLHRPMDAVIATCDGVNYLLTEEDLSSFFEAARRAIRPGGAFIFDVSTPHKLQNVLCRELFGEDRENITYLWANRWNGKRKIVEMDLTIFTREEDGRYRRIDEKQRQRAWEAQELKEMLWRCGFRAVSLYGDFGVGAARDENQRWHIAAMRGEDE
jgi:SAM-dependent methyltransferase